uniref:Uncharacterized protein n=1 Tax=Amazona collaria TaxID=241587 RepID=A0A8B9IYP6_9PSIT
MWHLTGQSSVMKTSASSSRHGRGSYGPSFSPPCFSYRNYGGVYVGLPSDAAAMVSSQTKAAPKGIERLCIVFLLLSQFNFNRAGCISFKNRLLFQTDWLALEPL